MKPLVLLVDDDRMVRELLATVLRNAGYDVKEAPNGFEALACMRASASVIDLLITDIEMPGMTGVELARAMRGLGTRCPMLFISGSSRPPEGRGEDWQFLAKPFHPNDLLNAVSTMLNPPPETKDARGARPRIVLAEDDGEMRTRLCRVLSAEYEVVAALEGGNSVLDIARELHPDVVLLDIAMPGVNGFAAARSILEAMPGLLVVFVTQYGHQAYIDEAMRTGVAGYVLKKDIVNELGLAIEQVRSGKRYISHGVRAA